MASRLSPGLCPKEPASQAAAGTFRPTLPPAPSAESLWAWSSCGQGLVPDGGVWFSGHVLRARQRAGVALWAGAASAVGRACPETGSSVGAGWGPACRGEAVVWPGREHAWVFSELAAWHSVVSSPRLWTVSSPPEKAVSSLSPWGDFPRVGSSACSSPDPAQGPSLTLFRSVLLLCEGHT